jgi:hypothetical protein
VSDLVSLCGLFHQCSSACGRGPRVVPVLRSRSRRSGTDPMASGFCFPCVGTLWTAASGRSARTRRGSALPMHVQGWSVLGASPAIGEFRVSQLRRHGSVHRRRCARWTTTFPRPPRAGGHLLRGGYAMTGFAADPNARIGPAAGAGRCGRHSLRQRSRPDPRVRGQERGALCGSGCRSEGRHEAVD